MILRSPSSGVITTTVPVVVIPAIWDPVGDQATSANHAKLSSGNRTLEELPSPVIRRSILSPPARRSVPVGDQANQLVLPSPVATVVWLQLLRERMITRPSPVPA